jgi:hemerythrin
MGNPLPWSENFAIGHEMIDGQHRLLVGLINEIAGAVHAKDHGRLAHLLKMLRLAAEDHVRQENSLLWEIRTGAHEGALRASKSLGVIRAMAETAFDQHIAEHGELLARFDEIARAPVAAIVEMLKAWFVDHAIKHDSQLKAIFQALR